MAFIGIEEPLFKELDSLTRDEGLRLYDVERCGPKLLRVYVDREGTDAKVTSGDCSRMVRRLMVYFVAEGAKFGLGSEPEIEVSSPGINRTLRRREQFQSALGQRVKVTPREESGMKSAIGVLEHVTENAVRVVDETTQEAMEFPLVEIKKANVDYKFS